VSAEPMRAARLHGLRELSVDRGPVPEAGAGELLVAVEGCGVCSTDARKFAIGVNDGEYPFNPGHEWLGRVVATGPDVDGNWMGKRVYGDRYGGYAEFATIAVRPAGWSNGALELDESLPLERAIFIEPFADCLHAVHDQARLEPGQLLAVIGGGSMGLQMIAAATRLGARTAVVEPMEARQRLARELGAETTLGVDGWKEAIRDWSGGRGVDAVIVAIGNADVVAESIEVAAAGGRVVAFAGLGDRGSATVDLNRLHYQEISLVGSEWVGTPPNQRFERYEQARELLESSELPLEQLVTAECGFDAVGGVLAEFGRHDSVKTLFRPVDAP
jgi:L-iditol 2-dehydrogenase